MLTFARFNLRPLVGALAVTIALVTGTACHRRLSAAPRADAAPLLMRVAELVESNGLAIDSGWPSFWPASRTYALFPFRGGALVVSSNPIDSAGGSVVVEASAPASLAGRAYFVRQLPQSHDHITLWIDDFRVGPHTMLAVSPLPSHGGLKDSLSSTIYLLLHESFHHLQLRTFVLDTLHFRGDSIRPSAKPLTVSDSEIRHALVLERAALSRTIQSRSEAGRLREYREYRRLRMVRVALMAARTARGEAYLEWLEGTASYVGLRGTTKAMGSDSAELVRLLSVYLERPAWQMGKQDFSGMHTWHLYAVGAAKAYLLDAIGADWHQKIICGHSMDDLLDDWVAAGTRAVQQYAPCDPMRGRRRGSGY